MGEVATASLAQRTSERANAAVELLEMLIHAQGRVVRRDQELWAGHTVLNYDRELLPRVCRATGLGLSVYLGNRRIATHTSLDAGPAPEVGAYADPEFVDIVLRRRQPFRGTLEVAGRPLLVAARPLFATDKPEEYGPVGILEAFHDLANLRTRPSVAADEPMLEPDAPGEIPAARLEAMTGFLDEVARRLQLLALNGNIIAAQAGDHGRAFRVVCRELSSLADQSKEVVGEARRTTAAAVPDPVMLDEIPDADGTA
jgi:hypothetical protein